MPPTTPRSICADDEPAIGIVTGSQRSCAEERTGIAGSWLYLVDDRHTGTRSSPLPSREPGDSPIGETVLFPFTLQQPYTMPPFSAVVPTPDTTGEFDLMGFPAGEDSVRKIKAVKPAAEIIAEMMAEAREILREELAATSAPA
jgi:hypothetical protein